jgi:hypothetical protein
MSMRSPPNFSSPNFWLVRRLRLKQQHSPGRRAAHGLGFIIIHQGKIANWLLTDWWESEILMHQRLYRSSPAEPSAFSPVQTDLVACIWELKVIEFQRAAWISSMSDPATGCDAERYLKAHFSALV